MSIIKSSFFSIYDSNFFKKYTLTLMVAVLLIALMEYMLMENLYKNSKELYIKRLSTVYDIEGDDINLLCNVMLCEYVKKDDLIFKSHNGILRRFDGTINLEDKIIQHITSIEFNDILFIKDDSKLFELVTGNTIVMFILMFFVYTILIFRHRYREYKTDVLKMNSYRLDLETRFQRDLAESLHHEMTLPISIIKAMVKSLYRNVYDLKIFYKDFDEKDIEVLEKHIEEKEFKRAIDRVAVKHYTKIMLNINILENILHAVAENKHIKYSTGNICIMKVIDSVLSGINVLSVKKMVLEYVNADVLENLAVDDRLSNPTFMTVVNHHFVNSKEAKTTKIKILAERKDNKFIYLYIQDNGIGIRDRNGNIKNTDEIFNSGYTTKDKNGNNIKENFFIKCFKKLGVIEDDNVPRGVGLYVNKQFLDLAGGDVDLIKTSPNGTIFRLLIPVKECKND